MNRPFVRLKDIAERTGFSINTVSVVLRGHSQLPEATRARILEVARELNYVPNAVARSLVRQTTQTVGVVLTNIMNPILTRAAQAIEQNLTALGYGTVFSISGYDLAKERAAIDRLLERQVDGILLYPANHGHLDHLETLRATGFPLVLLTRVRAGSFDIVSLDDRKGVLLAARHLVHLFGTSSVNAVLVDGAQQVLGSAAAPLAVLRPLPGHSEQDPQELWRALLDVLDSLRAAHRRSLPRSGHRPVRADAWCIISVEDGRFRCFEAPIPKPSSRSFLPHGSGSFTRRHVQMAMPMRWLRTGGHSTIRC